MYKFNSIHHLQLSKLCDGCPAPPDPNQWITGLEDLATYLGTNKETVRSWIKKGLIFAIKPDNKHYASNGTWLTPKKGVSKCNL